MRRGSSGMSITRHLAVDPMSRYSGGAATVRGAVASCHPSRTRFTMSRVDDAPCCRVGTGEAKGEEYLGASGCRAPSSYGKLFGSFHLQQRFVNPVPARSQSGRLRTPRGPCWASSGCARRGHPTGTTHQRPNESRQMAATGRVHRPVLVSRGGPRRVDPAAMRHPPCHLVHQQETLSYSPRSLSSHDPSGFAPRLGPGDRV
jgi:hypothetical protein